MEVSGNRSASDRFPQRRNWVLSAKPSPWRRRRPRRRRAVAALRRRFRENANPLSSPPPPPRGGKKAVSLTLGDEAPASEGCCIRGSFSSAASLRGAAQAVLYADGSLYSGDCWVLPAPESAGAFEEAVSEKGFAFRFEETTSAESHGEEPVCHCDCLPCTAAVSVLASPATAANGLSESALPPLPLLRGRLLRHGWGVLFSASLPAASSSQRCSGESSSSSDSSSASSCSSRSGTPRRRVESCEESGASEQGFPASLQEALFRVASRGLAAEAVEAEESLWREGRDFAAGSRRLRFEGEWMLGRRAGLGAAETRREFRVSQKPPLRSCTAETSVGKWDDDLLDDWGVQLRFSKSDGGLFSEESVRSGLLAACFTKGVPREGPFVFGCKDFAFFGVRRGSQEGNSISGLVLREQSENSPFPFILRFSGIRPSLQSSESDCSIEPMDDIIFPEPVTKRSAQQEGPASVAALESALLLLLRFIEESLCGSKAESLSDDSSVLVEELKCASPESRVFAESPSHASSLFNFFLPKSASQDAEDSTRAQEASSSVLRREHLRLRQQLLIQNQMLEAQRREIESLRARAGAGPAQAAPWGVWTTTDQGLGAEKKTPKNSGGAIDDGKEEQEEESWSDLEDAPLSPILKTDSLRSSSSSSSSLQAPGPPPFASPLSARPSPAASQEADPRRLPLARHQACLELLQTQLLSLQLPPLPPATRQTSPLERGAAPQPLSRDAAVEGLSISLGNEERALRAQVASRASTESSFTPISNTGPAALAKSEKARDRPLAETEQRDSQRRREADALQASLEAFFFSSEEAASEEEGENQSRVGDLRTGELRNVATSQPPLSLPPLAFPGISDDSQRRAPPSSSRSAPKVVINLAMPNFEEVREEDGFSALSSAPPALREASSALPEKRETAFSRPAYEAPSSSLSAVLPGGLQLAAPKTPAESLPPADVDVEVELSSDEEGKETQGNLRGAGACPSGGGESLCHLGEGEDAFDSAEEQETFVVAFGELPCKDTSRWQQSAERRHRLREARLRQRRLRRRDSLRKEAAAKAAALSRDERKERPLQHQLEVIRRCREEKAQQTRTAAEAAPALGASAASSSKSLASANWQEQEQFSEEASGVQHFSTTTASELRGPSQATSSPSGEAPLSKEVLCALPGGGASTEKSLFPSVVDKISEAAAVARECAERGLGFSFSQQSSFSTEESHGSGPFGKDSAESSSGGVDKDVPLEGAAGTFSKWSVSPPERTLNALFRAAKMSVDVASRAALVASEHWRGASVLDGSRQRFSGASSLSAEREELTRSPTQSALEASAAAARVAELLGREEISPKRASPSAESGSADGGFVSNEVCQTTTQPVEAAADGEGETKPRMKSSFSPTKTPSARRALRDYAFFLRLQDFALSVDEAAQSEAAAARAEAAALLGGGAEECGSSLLGFGLETLAQWREWVSATSAKTPTRVSAKGVAALIRCVVSPAPDVSAAALLRREAPRGLVGDAAPSLDLEWLESQGVRNCQDALKKGISFLRFVASHDAALLLLPVLLGENGKPGDRRGGQEGLAQRHAAGEASLRKNSAEGAVDVLHATRQTTRLLNKAIAEAVKAETPRRAAENSL